MSYIHSFGRVDIRNHTSPKAKWQIIPLGRRAQEQALNFPKGALSNVGLPGQPKVDIRLTPIPFAITKWGLTWYELRDIIAAAFVSKTLDAPLFRSIRKAIAPYVPVRSGKLLDTICTTMKIIRRSIRKVVFFFGFTFLYPPDRPRIIYNPQHNPPKMGYGELYYPKTVIRNVMMLKKTKGGNALYLLNDPTAFSDSIAVIKDIADRQIVQQLEDLFNMIELRCRV